MLLPDWTVEIQVYNMGIRKSHDPNRKWADLHLLGLTVARTEAVILDLTSQALVELTDIYDVRYAACVQVACVQVCSKLERKRMSQP
jgi:hypothetical protein